ncbi:MAG: histidine kinase, partial [Gemmatimonas sp.]
MWTFARGDLKLRLTLRVAAVSAVCFAAIAAYFLVDADRSVHARIDGIAEVAAKTLELQQSKIQWINNSRREFPDLDVIAASVMTPGLCLAYRTSSGDILQRFCGGIPSEKGEPPRAFAEMYRYFFDPGREATRPVLSAG